ncbi:conserved Plasmodium protein, unknown function [Plasmodium gallinaceum]|uniref:Chromo domain-containing protein n=1 Tax=Plasmodium gallinaceum TaxID=5849 RepID=A0A1J1GV78_PLAGA|nr:conserved Plasmodium protein, unknown function [Plasmodium gallinaceum]CRG96457.1 conserved Plasmodium protein, unknown function [Plasmodium gallinaceum]
MVIKKNKNYANKPQKRNKFKNIIAEDYSSEVSLTDIGEPDYNDVFEVEKIVMARYKFNRKKKKNGKEESLDNFEFFIKWKNYDSDENTWEPFENLSSTLKSQAREAALRLKTEMDNMEKKRKGININDNQSGENVTTNEMENNFLAIEDSKNISNKVELENVNKNNCVTSLDNYLIKNNNLLSDININSCSKDHHEKRDDPISSKDYENVKNILCISDRKSNDRFNNQNNEHIGNSKINILDNIDNNYYVDKNNIYNTTMNSNENVFDNLSNNPNEHINQNNINVKNNVHVLDNFNSIHNEEKNQIHHTNICNEPNILCKNKEINYTNFSKGISKGDKFICNKNRDKRKFELFNVGNSDEQNKDIELGCDKSLKKVNLNNDGLFKEDFLSKKQYDSSNFSELLFISDEIYEQYETKNDLNLSKKPSEDENSNNQLTNNDDNSVSNVTNELLCLKDDYPKNTGRDKDVIKESKNENINVKINNKFIITHIKNKNFEKEKINIDNNYSNKMNENGNNEKIECDDKLKLEEKNKIIEKTCINNNANFISKNLKKKVSDKKKLQKKIHTGNIFKEKLNTLKKNMKKISKNSYMFKLNMHDLENNYEDKLLDFEEVNKTNEIIDKNKFSGDNTNICINDHAKFAEKIQEKDKSYLCKKMQNGNKLYEKNDSYLSKGGFEVNTLREIDKNEENCEIINEDNCNSLKEKITEEIFNKKKMNISNENVYEEKNIIDFIEVDKNSMEHNKNRNVIRKLINNSENHIIGEESNIENTENENRKYKSKGFEVIQKIIETNSSEKKKKIEKEAYSKINEHKIIKKSEYAINKKFVHPHSQEQNKNVIERADYFKEINDLEKKMIYPNDKNITSIVNDISYYINDKNESKFKSNRNNNEEIEKYVLSVCNQSSKKNNSNISKKIDKNDTSNTDKYIKKIKNKDSEYTTKKYNEKKKIQVDGSFINKNNENNQLKRIQENNKNILIHNEAIKNNENISYLLEKFDKVSFTKQMHHSKIERRKKDNVKKGNNRSNNNDNTLNINYENSINNSTSMNNEMVINLKDILNIENDKYDYYINFLENILNTLKEKRPCKSSDLILLDGLKSNLNNKDNSVQNSSILSNINVQNISYNKNIYNNSSIDPKESGKNTIDKFDKKNKFSNDYVKIIKSSKKISQGNCIHDNNETKKMKIKNVMYISHDVIENNNAPCIINNELNAEDLSISSNKRLNENNNEKKKSKRISSLCKNNEKQKIENTAIPNSKISVKSKNLLKNEIKESNILRSSNKNNFNKDKINDYQLDTLNINDIKMNYMDRYNQYYAAIDGLVLNNISALIKNMNIINFYNSQNRNCINFINGSFQVHLLESYTNILLYFDIFNDFRNYNFICKNCEFINILLDNFCDSKTTNRNSGVDNSLNDISKNIMLFDEIFRLNKKMNIFFKKILLSINIKPNQFFFPSVEYFEKLYIYLNYKKDSSKITNEDANTISLVKKSSKGVNLKVNKSFKDINSNTSHEYIENIKDYNNNDDCYNKNSYDRGKNRINNYEQDGCQTNNSNILEENVENKMVSENNLKNDDHSNLEKFKQRKIITVPKHNGNEYLEKMLTQKKNNNEVQEKNIPLNEMNKNEEILNIYNNKINNIMENKVCNDDTNFIQKHKGCNIVNKNLKCIVKEKNACIIKGKQDDNIDIINHSDNHLLNVNIVKNMEENKCHTIKESTILKKFVDDNMRINNGGGNISNVSTYNNKDNSNIVLSNVLCNGNKDLGDMCNSNDVIDKKCINVISLYNNSNIIKYVDINNLNRINLSQINVEEKTIANDNSNTKNDTMAINTNVNNKITNQTNDLNNLNNAKDDTCNINMMNVCQTQIIHGNINSNKNKIINEFNKEKKNKKEFSEFQQNSVNKDNRKNEGRKCLINNASNDFKNNERNETMVCINDLEKNNCNENMDIITSNFKFNKRSNSNNSTNSNDTNNSIKSNHDINDCKGINNHSNTKNMMENDNEKRKSIPLNDCNDLLISEKHYISDEEKKKNNLNNFYSSKDKAYEELNDSKINDMRAIYTYYDSVKNIDDIKYCEKRIELYKSTKSIITKYHEFFVNNCLNLRKHYPDMQMNYFGAHNKLNLFNSYDLKDLDNYFIKKNDKKYISCHICSYNENICYLSWIAYFEKEALFFKSQKKKKNRHANIEENACSLNSPDRSRNNACINMYSDLRKKEKNYRNSNSFINSSVQQNNEQIDKGDTCFILDDNDSCKQKDENIVSDITNNQNEVNKNDLSGDDNSKKNNISEELNLTNIKEKNEDIILIHNKINCLNKTKNNIIENKKLLSKNVQNIENGNLEENIIEKNLLDANRNSSFENRDVNINDSLKNIHKNIIIEENKNSSDKINSIVNEENDVRKSRNTENCNISYIFGDNENEEIVDSGSKKNYIYNSYDLNTKKNINNNNMNDNADLNNNGNNIHSSISGVSLIEQKYNNNDNINVNNYNQNKLRNPNDHNFLFESNERVKISNRRFCDMKKFLCSKKTLITRLNLIKEKGYICLFCRSLLSVPDNLIKKILNINIFKIPQELNEEVDEYMFFKLDDTDFRELSANSKRLELRGIKLDMQRFWNPYISFPKHFSIVINYKHTIKLPYFDRAIKRVDREIVIPSRYLKHGCNVIMLSLKNRKAEKFLIPEMFYCFTLCIINNIEASTLHVACHIIKYSIVEEKLCKLHLANLIKSKLCEDNDIQIVNGQNNTINFFCPYTYSKIKLPCKSISCKHLDPFCFASWIISQNKLAPNKKWKCPICDVSCFPHEVMIDSFYKNICDSLNENNLNTEVLYDWKNGDVLIKPITKNSGATKKNNNDVLEID